MERIDMIISNNAEIVELPRNLLQQQQQQPSQISSDPTSPEVQIKQIVDPHKQEIGDSGQGWYL